MHTSTAEDTTQWFWIALLAGATVALSLVFACATPFAALATIAALAMSRRDGLYLIAAVWLSNQIVGFGFLDYPHTASTYAWGVAIGLGALAGFFAAHAAASISARLGWLAAGIAALVTSFGAYEAVLYAASFVLGGEGAFTAEIVGQIAIVNAAAFAGLVVLHRLAVMAGVARSAAERSEGSVAVSAQLG